MKNEIAISLDQLHAALGWPKISDITHPQGQGAAIFASLARSKIGRILERFSDAEGSTVGVLVADPNATETTPPIAVVVTFHSDASDITLRELHRLTWNFSHSPMLVTIEPGLLRVWSCCEAPSQETPISDRLVHTLTREDIVEDESSSLERLAAQALHWINLVSGEFFRQYPDRFNRDGRADQMLLGNLRHIRSCLSSAGLSDDDICHDLLARIIFVQFLFDRKDSDGNPALTATRLAKLFAENILKNSHQNFHSILGDYEDTYSLFDWLNTRFNGDLFPGKGDTVDARTADWQKEKSLVTKEHLALLADFIRGDLDMPSGQGCLWPQYSFDVIPLEFISSIYETFVTERAAKEGIFYTPPHLVDFILDRVLPWDGYEWDISIIDPACGSGIFLVKAFQRLVHRWKRANPNQTVKSEILKRLLERNIFGVDKDPHAVRVACFSLYLAMCDEIDPRQYWNQIVFPTMRGRRLVCSDFFAEDHQGFSTSQESSSYDLVIGNAPWGDNLITEKALKWATSDDRHWPIANKDIGSLFLPKAAELLKSSGQIAMIQSANSLLFNRSEVAQGLRAKLFTKYTIREIYNLSALRFQVFKRKSHTLKKSVAPSCIVIMTAEPPSANHRVSYISPKQMEHSIDDFSIIIEPQDRKTVPSREAAIDSTAWTALMWGSSRDCSLLKKLSNFPSLAKYQATQLEEFAFADESAYASQSSSSKIINHKEGLNFGSRSLYQPQLNGRRIFDENSFPTDSLLYLDSESLPELNEVYTHRNWSDLAAFSLPQLIVKPTWQTKVGRFQSRIVKSENNQGILCTQSYISVNAPQEIIEAACISLNSMVATYFLQLTSGRFAAYRPEVLVKELITVPIPHPEPDLLAELNSLEDVDCRAFEAFKLKEAETTLISDLCNYTIPDFRGDSESPGRQRTPRSNGEVTEPFLRDYCEHFVKVIKAGFGQDKSVRAVIFNDSDSIQKLPYRLVAFELDSTASEGITISKIKSTKLLQELERLDHFASENFTRRGIYNERVARIYDSSNGVATVFLLKPDMKRYWTKSTGLNDADEVALDLFRWRNSSTPEKGVRP